MKKSLVIVESPAKARTISKYLGDEFEVKASMGHVRDLPKSKLGVDVEKNFGTVYEVIPGKEKVMQEIRRAASRADAIYLAADPDREGEAICQHIRDELPKNRSDIYRVTFHEITKNAVKEAFQSAGAINENLVKAQHTRRILDRLVGYKVSPLLWKKVQRGLSAGRVQTVALRMVVEREREIRAFVSEEYWIFSSHLQARVPPVFKARAIKLDGKKFKVASSEEAGALKRELEGAPFVVDSVSRTAKKQQPRPPFITSKLQQEANRRFRFTAKKTMQVAQRLYEGVDIGPEGSTGLITYMRTDSTRVSPTAVEGVRQYIQEAFGQEYLPARPRQYQASASAQDAHEAIRPTDVTRTPAAMKPFLTPDELKVYTLVWQRFTASQMEAAVFDHTDIKVAAGRCLFQAVGDVLKFPGFLKVYREAEEDDPSSRGQAVKEGGEDPDSPVAETEGALPPVVENEVLSLVRLETQQQFTQPPPRYTEATLIKSLEEKGIGRPSTYAQIVGVIQDRSYVEKEDGRFRPKEIGEIVVDRLVEGFPELFGYEYTAKMEKQLDLIEQGKRGWLPEIRDFYERFSTALARADKEMKSLRAEVEATDEICDQCGEKMVIRWGRFGKFLSCSKYPACKGTRDLSDPGQGAGETPEGGCEAEKCDACGSPMARRMGRFGAFMACSKYPECKTTRKIGAPKEAGKEPKVQGEACPECERPLVERHGRFGAFVSCSGYPKCKYVKREKTGVACPQPGCGGEIVPKRAKGKAFYGCSKYPDCTYSVWSKPFNRPCPKCGGPLLLERETKRDGRFLECPDKECKAKVKPEEESLT